MACDGCTSEIALFDKRLKKDILTGCSNYRMLSDCGQEVTDAILQMLARNYFELSKNGNNTQHASIWCNELNKYSKNYNFLLRHLNCIESLHRSFETLEDLDIDSPKKLRELKKDLLGLYRTAMNGVFPNHFQTRDTHKLSFERRVNDFEKTLTDL